MKKMLLLAAAVMVSLSSCVKTNEVYTGKMQEMGFKSAVTRNVIQSNDDMTYPIAVSSVWDNPSDASGDFVVYFENAKFVHDVSTSLWKGDPAKYWPTSGDMYFLALCPYPVNATITNSYNVDGTFKNVVFGTIDNNLKDQHDVLFSDILSVEAPQTSAQPLLFHHAYAQLNVTFKKTDSAAAVVVKSVTANNVNLTGALTVTPVIGPEGPGTSTATWQTGLGVNRYFLPVDAPSVEAGTLDAVLAAADAYSPSPVLVIPGAQTQFTIVYTIDGIEHTYKHVLTGEWQMGYKYTYNYTINVNEIIFDCTVEDWIPADGGSVTI